MALEAVLGAYAGQERAEGLVQVKSRSQIKQIFSPSTSSSSPLAHPPAAHQAGALTG